MTKVNANNNAKIEILVLIGMYHVTTPFLKQQTLSSKQIVDKTPTELQFIEKFVSMKEVNTQNLWTSELGTPEGINVPIWITIGFQQWLPSRSEFKQ